MQEPTQEPSDLGRRLRSLREARGWSRDLLARKSGITTMTILRTEVHGTDPTLATVQSLATALDVTVSELVGDHDPAAA